MQELFIIVNRILGYHLNNRPTITISAIIFNNIINIQFKTVYYCYTIL